MSESSSPHPPAASLLRSMNELKVARLSKATLWHLAMATVWPFFVAMSTLCGVFALFGAHTVTVNGSYVTGFGGLIAGVIVGVILGWIMCAFLWVAMCLGYWLYRKFTKHLTIFYIPAEDAAPKSDGNTPPL